MLEECLGPLSLEVEVTEWRTARTSEHGVTRRVSWQALADEYRALGEQVKEKALLQAPSFCTVRAECKPGACDYAKTRPLKAHRCSSSVQSVTAIGLDYDAKEVDWRERVGRLDAIGLAYLVHDSPSHHSDAPKWRIYIPIVSPWTSPAEWSALYGLVKGAVEELLGIRFDDKTTDACRIFYPPTRCNELDQDRRVLWREGKALDLKMVQRRFAVQPPLPNSDESRKQAAAVPPSRRPADEDQPLSALERASLYLAKCDPSVSGQGGHNAAMHAASVLVRGFALPPDQALDLLVSEFNPRCTPPWNKKDLKHKVESALKKGRMVMGSLLQSGAPARAPSPPPAPSASPLPSPPPRPKQDPPGSPPPLNLIIVRDKPKNGFANLKQVLSNAPEFWRKIRLNDFSHAVEVHGTLPWKRDPSCLVWKDTDDVEASAYIETAYQFSPTTTQVCQAVGAVAEANKYNPVKDYLDQCKAKWDGMQRMDTWLLDLCGSRILESTADTLETLEETAARNEYIRLVGRKFLIAAVARALTPGCKVDTVLILEGKQARGKSTAVQTLFGAEWFTDQLADIGSKSADEQLAGKWGIEIPELDATKGASATKEKAFFSRQVDRFRPAYGRAVVEYPRSCIFVGTTNKTQYLKDETGGRRFQPVAILRPINIAGLRACRNQLWGEAVRALEAGEAWWLSEAETELAQNEQEARYQVDALEGDVVEYITGRPEVTVDDVLEHLFAPYLGRPAAERYSNGVASRVGKVLRRLGWTMVQRRDRDASSGRRRVYVPPCATRSTCAGQNPRETPQGEHLERVEQVTFN